MGRRCQREKETTITAFIRDTVAFSCLEKLSLFILNFAKKEHPDEGRSL